MNSLSMSKTCALAKRLLNETSEQNAVCGQREVVQIALAYVLWRRQDWAMLDVALFEAVEAIDFDAVLGVAQSVCGRAPRAIESAAGTEILVGAIATELHRRLDIF